MVDKQTRTVDATGTSFEIVEALVDLGGAGVSELATTLDIPKSTTHNHLQTLIKKVGWIAKSGMTLTELSETT